MTQYKEYKVIRISEGILGTLFLGSSSLSEHFISKKLTEEAQSGWQVVFQIIEKKRTILFWSRESLLVTLGR